LFQNLFQTFFIQIWDRTVTIKEIKPQISEIKALPHGYATTQKKRVLRITWIAVNSTGEFSFLFFGFCLFLWELLFWLLSFLSFFCYEAATGGYGGKRLLEF
jgi:hypothetical protein